MTLDLQTLERWLWDSADIPRGISESLSEKSWMS